MPAAAILIAIGAISVHQAAAQVAGLAPVVAFLGAVLVLAKLCDDEGLFEAAGAAMARVSPGSHGLLRQVFVIAATITAALSLDATVVLLTPVVLVPSAGCGPRCGHTPTPPPIWPTPPRCCFRCRI